MLHLGGIPVHHGVDNHKHNQMQMEWNWNEWDLGEEEEEADEYGSYGYAASPSLGEAARSIPKPLMPPLPTETHSTGAIAASSIICFPTR